MNNISSIIRDLSDFMNKTSAEKEDITNSNPDPNLDPTQTEEKDKDTLLQEHVKNNIDKYRKSFEDLFPETQMMATNVEYRGEVIKDKIRVQVEFQTPLLNFDALEIMANKEIGIEATGENTFKVYNIYLPMVKDPTIE
jgi:hypothetical protein